MISLIVTAYEDPNSTKECIRRLLEQKNLNEKFELIAACPDEPTKKVIMDYKKKHPSIVKYVKQDDGDKNQLMNKIIKIAKGDILIWTDGNKFMEENSISFLLEPFKDPLVGIAGGRPTSMNERNNLFGYWSHLLTDSSDKVKQKLFREGKFVEHSANILAHRKNLIKKIPLDVAEDAIISYLVSSKGYKNVYVPEAKVLVMYPRNLKDWIKQKVRSIKSHEALNKYVPNKNLKMKSFANEVIYGVLLSLTHPKNLREVYWALLLYPARLYIWGKSFYEIKIKKIPYTANWSRSQSTKVLDYKK